MSDGTFSAQVTSRKLIICVYYENPSLECRSDPTLHLVVGGMSARVSRLPLAFQQFSAGLGDGWLMELLGTFRAAPPVTRAAGVTQTLCRSYAGVSRSQADLGHIHYQTKIYVSLSLCLCLK